MNDGVVDIIINNIYNNLQVFDFDSNVIGETIQAGDSLELWISFCPDSSVDYHDTLTVESNYYSTTATISGTGLGAYLDLSTDSLIFDPWEPNTPYGSMNFTMTNQGNDDMLVMNINSINPTFVVNASMFYMLDPGEVSNPIQVTFIPPSEDFHEGLISLFTNAYNVENDTAYIYCSGMWEVTPGPVSVSIIHDDPDIELTWLPVDTSIYGNPITVDYYLIFYSELPYNPDSLYFFHGYTADTTYTHFGVAQFSEHMFYQVTAYIGDIGVLDEMTAGKAVISKEEIMEKLRIVNEE
ncbi:MAG: hypothetical protein H8D45_20150 [Bacteroidetes bacterium]|nr:hypothetical protein [Bacteroidota bacterium]